MFQTGIYAAVFPLRENKCYLNKDGKSQIIERQFEIHYIKSKSRITVNVAPEQIYSLCTGTGKWGSITPIIVKLSEN